MKILLMQLSGRGGTQVYTACLANALAETNDVYVMLGSHLVNDYYDKKVKIIPVNSPITYHEMIWPVINPLTYYGIYRRILEIDPDVIHVTFEFVWDAMILQVLKKYPVILTEHNPEFHSGTRFTVKVYMGMSKYLSKKAASAIVVFGDKMKEALVKKGIPGNKIHVLPLGEYSLYSKRQKEGIVESNSVLFFGSIMDYKGLEYLIKAEPLITSAIPDAKIVIAGSGDFRKYEPMIRNPDSFQVINRFIPDEMVPELFQRSSLVVLPYVDASQTGVVPVAYTFKKPVIATSVGSLPEAVDDGVTGLIVPPRDSRALADAVIRLLSDAGLRKTMGEKAFKKASEELSWEKIARGTVSIYKGLLEEKT